MIKILLSCLLLSFAASAGAQVPGQYTIQGKVKGTDQSSIAYLYSFDKKRNLLDSAVIRNGEFRFTGKVRHPLSASIQIKKWRKSLSLFLENQDYQVWMYPDWKTKDSLTGGTEMQIQKNYEADTQVLSRKMQELGQRYEKLGKEERIKEGEELNKLNEQETSIKYRYIKKYPASLAVLHMMRPSFEVMNFKQLQEMKKRFSPELAYSDVYQHLLELYEKKKAEYQVGQQAPDFALNTLDGKKFSLSSLKGKYVLLDFWASWCTPCRAANQKVIPVYEKYRNKGFEMVSVSMDDKKEAWAAAVKKDGLPWIQVSGLTGIKDCPVARSYHVTSLPTLFLLDKTGKVIAQNIDDQELEKLLAEFTREKKSQSGKQVLLKNATILDGIAAHKPFQGSILVQDGLISRIYKKGETLPENISREIDCSGKFITPGLFDAHVHLATGEPESPEKTNARIEPLLANMLKHGITTVRDMAGDGPTLALYQRASELQQIKAPAIFYAAQFAGASYFELYKRGSHKPGNRYLGTTPWYCSITPGTDIRLAVAQAKGAGASGIKIYADLSAKQIEEITREAHLQGLQAWSHAAVFPAKPGDGVRAGVNSMSHSHDISFDQLPDDTINISNAWQQAYKGISLDMSALDRLLLEMKKKEIYLDPTVFHASNNKMKNAFVVTRRAHQLGLRIVTGTDWIYPEKDGKVPLLDEMKVLADSCGMSNAEILQSATYYSALVTGLKDRGLIKEGLRADLLLLHADPLKELGNLFEPVLVMKEGEE